MTKPFVHLHVHSEYSILDGLGRQGDYLKRAVEMGHPAIAFTEHGSMRGAYKLHENVLNMDPDARPWPIYGCEFYVCEDRHSRGLPADEVERIKAANKGRKAIGDALYKRELELGLRQRYHLTVLAKSQEGIANLFRLTSTGWLEGYWKRPRIDLETLERHREGLIVLSGCSGGVVPQLIVDGNVALADKRMEWLVERFGEDFYMEIMPTSYPDQAKVNKAMLRYSRRFNRPLVATVDAHYIRKEHARTHEVLLCIRTHDVMSDPNRFRFSVSDFWLKDYNEMMEGFQTFHPYIDRADVRRALTTTLEIAEKCQARLIIDRFKALVPTPGIPAKYKGNEFAFITDLCWTGWESRDMFARIKRLAAQRGVPYDDLVKQYMDRLRYELAALKRQNVVSYFLVIWDMYRWAKEEAKIVCGPGRGSAGGCLVSYLLRITDVDPIEHGLLFERFLNPDRIDLPDIDCDFEDERRDEVIQYLRRKYGPDKTSQISTITSLKGKQCIRDISRALEIPFSEVDEVTSSVIERSSGDERASQTIEDSFADFDVCRKFNERHPEVLEHARILESHARGLGVHAAGIVVSPKPLTEIIPMETRERAGVTEVVTGMEMWGVQGMGLVKIDLLGLRNLTVIKHCLEKVKERHGVEIDLNTVDLNDPKVLANFTAHAYTGVFQYDTPSADKITEGVEFTTFEDVVAMIALDRPGTARSGLAAEYLKRKKDPTRIRTVHPVIDAICSDTYGVIVYQEHVIKMFTDVAGFAPGTADSLRKKIAKKFGDEALGKERENFIKGATARGFDPALAAKIMDQITFFGSYGFNKSHSTAYALIGYWEMLLKTYYPHEFVWALLYCERDDVAIRRFVKECNRLGIRIVHPHVNRSKSRFTLDGDDIVGSLIDVKGCGSIAAESIEANAPFKSFTDFLKRVDRRKVHKGVVMALARAGALDGLIPNRKWFIENIENIWAVVGKGKWDEVESQLAASKKQPAYTEQEAVWGAAEVCPLASGKHPMVPYEDLLSKTMSPDWVSMSDETLFDRRHGFLNGIIVEVKYNQIGDFHTGQLPDEDERKRRRWGARYANVNIEDLSGKNNRVKVDVDTFDVHRPIIDKGIGTPVAFHASIDGKWKSIRVHFMVALDELRKKLDAGEPLDVFERVMVRGRNPLKAYTKDDIERKIKDAKGNLIDVVGVVTHLNVKPDKKMNDMAFFGLLGYRGYTDVLCFASSWSVLQGKFDVGDIVRMRLERRDGTCFLERRYEDELKVLERRSSL